MREALVLAEQVADLAAAHADVTGGHVGVLGRCGGDSSVMKDWQKRMTSASDLPLRVEVGAALAAADGQAGQGVLEDLLEAEELDDAQR